MYVAITCYTLLHQTTRGEGKNSLRECRYIPLSIMILNDFSLLYYCNFNLYIIFSLKKLNFYGDQGPEAESRRPDKRTEDRGPDNPNTPLLYRCFRICSSWTQFYTEFTFLKGTFWKNGYLKTLLKSFLKKLLNNIYLVKKPVATRKIIPSILKNNIFAN